jgi:Zn-finger protein
VRMLTCWCPFGDLHSCMSVVRSVEDRNNDSVEACRSIILVCARRKYRRTTHNQTTQTHRWNTGNERKALHHNTSFSAYQRERKSPVRHTSSSSAQQHLYLWLLFHHVLHPRSASSPSSVPLIIKVMRTPAKQEKQDAVATFCYARSEREKRNEKKRMISTQEKIQEM